MLRCVTESLLKICDLTKKRFEMSDDDTQPLLFSEFFIHRKIDFNLFFTITTTFLMFCLYPNILIYLIFYMSVCN